MLDGDWFALLDGAARGNIEDARAFRTKPGAALSVVMAAEHYPKTPKTGDRIEGLDAELAEGAYVFHAGTKRDGDAVLTAGGRVLTVGAYADSLQTARDRAYATVAKIAWRGEHHRQDIGHRALPPG
jgi:phosphoribosylamine--glycine ligase